ncbi:MAG: DUF308 domain-containing protein [Firmicutes bacterium]|nr:DUF308 domain-containing protein [Bacillota bacterium]
MNVNGLVNKLGSEGLMNQKAVLSQVLLLLYGIFMLVFPAKALNLSVGFIGVVMILAGLFCGIKFFKDRAAGNYPLLAIGVIGLAVGILTMVFRSAIALVLFPIMLGVWTFASTLLAGFAAFNNYRSGNGIWWVPLLAAIVGAVVTVLIFMNLSGTERFMARILGIYFITYNIIRLGELAAAYFAPAPVEKQPRKKQAKPASRRRVYEETEEEQEFDIYDYEDDGYEAYRRSRRYDDDDFRY